MPTYKDVEVHVVDDDGYALPEYGCQKRDGMVTCYIQSTAGMRFEIDLYADKYKIVPEPVDADEKRRMMALYPAPPRRGKIPAPRDGRLYFRAPWHLLATLHFNGRKEIEASKLLYLDEEAKSETTMKARLVEDSDGLHDHTWHFTEVGIEDVFQKLQVNTDDDEQEPAETNEEMLQKLHLDDDDEQKPTETKQENPTLNKRWIEVKLVRRNIGLVTREKGTNYYEAPAEPEMSASDLKETSHTVTHQKGKQRSSMRERIDHWPVDPDEKPYAIFRFYYRNEDVLRKLNFLGAEEEQTATHDGQAQDAPIAREDSVDADRDEVDEVRRGVKKMRID